VVSVSAVCIAVRALELGGCLGKKEFGDGSRFRVMGWVQRLRLVSLVFRFFCWPECAVLFHGGGFYSNLLRTSAHGIKLRRDGKSEHPQRPVIQPPRTRTSTSARRHG